MPSTLNGQYDAVTEQIGALFSIIDGHLKIRRNDRDAEGGVTSQDIIEATRAREGLVRIAASLIGETPADLRQKVARFL